MTAFLEDNYGKLGYVQNLDKPEIFQQMVINSFQNQTFNNLLLLLLASTLIFLYANIVKNSIFKFAILFLLIFDLFLFGGKVNILTNYNDLLKKNDDNILILQQELSSNSARIYTFNNFWSNLLPNQLLPYHIPEANGFASLPLKRFETWQKIAEASWLNNNSLLFQLGSIKYVYALKNGNPTLTTIDNPLPRAYMSSQWSSAKSDSEAFDLIASPNFDPSTVILETNDIKDFSNIDTVMVTPAVITNYNPDYVKIQYYSPHDGILVLTDTNYPGWEAYLNSKKVSIYQANYLFRGVKAPAGDNIIEFKYQPRYLNISLVISSSATLFILFLFSKRLLKGKI